MSKIETDLKIGAFSSKHVRNLIELLYRLDITTPNNIKEAITAFQAGNQTDFLKDATAKQVLQKLNELDGNTPLDVKLLNRVFKKLSPQDKVVVFAFLTQNTYRKTKMRWGKDGSSTAKQIEAKIKKEGKKLLQLAEEMGVFDEKPLGDGVEPDLVIVHGSTMQTVEARLDYALEQLEKCKGKEFEIILGCGNRKLLDKKGKRRDSDDKVLDPNGGFIEAVAERFGKAAKEVTEKDGVAYLLEKKYGLKDGKVKGISCRVATLPPQELCERTDITDTYGATRQVIRDIKESNPEYFNSKRTIVSVSNGIYTQRQGLTLQRAFEEEFSGKLPNGIRFIAIGAAKKPEISYPICSDIIGASFSEIAQVQCPKLKKCPNIWKMGPRAAREVARTKQAASAANRAGTERPKHLSASDRRRQRIGYR